MKKEEIPNVMIAAGFFIFVALLVAYSVAMCTAPEGSSLNKMLEETKIAQESPLY